MDRLKINREFIEGYDNAIDGANSMRRIVICLDESFGKRSANVNAAMIRYDGDIDVSHWQVDEKNVIWSFDNDVAFTIGDDIIDDSVIIMICASKMSDRTWAVEKAAALVHFIKRYMVKNAEVVVGCDWNVITSVGISWELFLELADGMAFDAHMKAKPQQLIKEELVEGES